MAFASPYILKLTEFETIRENRFDNPAHNRGIYDMLQAHTAKE
ncbi:hypothetical protein [Paenibacillus sp. Root52]|nr:hypothetical protein [Paenibacillus sp. Root52]